MIIPARVDGIDTVIIGYGPGPKAPVAIVVWQAPSGTYFPRPVPLADVELTRLPKKLRHRLAKVRAKGVAVGGVITEVKP